MEGVRVDTEEYCIALEEVEAAMMNAGQAIYREECESVNGESVAKLMAAYQRYDSITRMYVNSLPEGDDHCLRVLSDHKDITATVECMQADASPRRQPTFESTQRSPQRADQLGYDPTREPTERLDEEHTLVKSRYTASLSTQKEREKERLESEIAFLTKQFEIEERERQLVRDSRLNAMKSKLLEITQQVDELYTTPNSSVKSPSPTPPSQNEKRMQGDEIPRWREESNMEGSSPYDIDGRLSHTEDMQQQRGQIPPPQLTVQRHQQHRDSQLQQHGQNPPTQPIVQHNQQHRNSLAQQYNLPPPFQQQPERQQQQLSGMQRATSKQTAHQQIRDGSGDGSVAAVHKSRDVNNATVHPMFINKANQSDPMNVLCNEDIKEFPRPPSVDSHLSSVCADNVKANSKPRNTVQFKLSDNVVREQHKIVPPGLYQSNQTHSSQVDRNLRPSHHVLNSRLEFYAREAAPRSYVSQHENYAASHPHSRMLAEGLSHSPYHQSYQKQYDKSRYQEDSSRSQQFMPLGEQLIAALQAPQAKLPMFDGDPLKYHGFIVAFTHSVEERIADPTARLTRLVQHCQGKALAVLQGCLSMPSEQGYSKARQILRERFGTPHRISQAWVNHILSQDKIKGDDGLSLQAYADLLSTACSTLESVGGLIEVSAQQTIVDIISKLPSYLQNRWRSNAVQIMKERLIQFADVVSFVERAAEEMSLPGFESRSRGSQGESRNNQKGKKRESSSMFVTTDHKKQECSLCNQNHRLSQCDIFRKKDIRERYELVKRFKLCFNCLRGQHSAKKCVSKFSCRKCDRKHHTLLHRDDSNYRSSTQREVTVHSTSDKVIMHPSSNDTMHPSSKDVMLPSRSDAAYHSKIEKVANCLVNAAYQVVALPIVSVIIKAPGSQKEVKTYALLDSGSTSTFCTPKILEELGIKGSKQRISLSTISESTESMDTTVVDIEVLDKYERNMQSLTSVIVCNQIPVSELHVPQCSQLANYPHLAGLDIPEPELGEVTLLIGQDHSECLVPLEVKRGMKGQPYATRSMLGWSINGPLTTRGKQSLTNHVASYHVTVNSSCCDRLHEDIKAMWALETNEMSDSREALSQVEKEVTQMWKATTTIEGGRYVMPIPFKDTQPKLPDSREMAQRRLNHLSRRFQKSESLRVEYTQAMNEVIEQGYAEEVQDEEMNRQDGKVWYVPHHPVLNPKKGKLRIVYDCAAQYCGQSLNQHIHAGPDLIQKLAGVLLRFRLGRVAVMADIKAMYYQVAVKRDDRDVLRFLWWPQGDTSSTPKTYRMTRHLFGGTWSPSCCTTALQYAIEESSTLTAQEQEQALQSFYVDDYLRSMDNEQEAQRTSRAIRDALQMRKFTLTKWTSNYPEIVKEFIDPHTNPSPEKLKLAESEKERALGIIWNKSSDELGYDVCVTAKPTTRRGILSMLSSVFDPLGLASPFVLKARLIVQRLCREKLGWDEPIPDNELKEWKKWTSELPDLALIKVPRWVRPSDDNEEYQLHHFSDGSTKAYGVVSYLVSRSSDGKISSHIMTAKARLVPLKAVSIPRIELMASTLAARQDAYMKKALESTITLLPSQFWSDSMIVLSYIRNKERKFHTFVSNRVATIRDHSKAEQWHHIKGEENPADDCSRGLSPMQLMSERWLYGPDVIRQAKSLQWPVEKEVPLHDDDPEMKKEKPVCLMVQASNDPLHKLMSYYSDWNRLRRAVAWLKLIVRAKITKSTTMLPMSPEIIKEAEKQIVKWMQREAYGNEMEDLKQRNQVSNSSKLKQLKPVMIDGLLCVGGRIEHASIPMSARHPAIIPGRHHVSQLMIQRTHASLGHAGREHVMAQLRENYWIVSGRTAVRQELSRCVPCKRREANPVTQIMADLPEDRLIHGGHPFKTTGVDLFGPFPVKFKRGRDVRYACLFTCLTTRAVHLEIVHNLSADSFMQALQRFTARRGKVEVMRSDNGRNFVRAERELRENMQSWSKMKDIEDKLNDKGIQWIFNPPYASSHGGVWERQIRTIRRVIAGVCKEQVLTDESLHTLFCTVENIVNSRPLTVVSTDPDDFTPLTPNHLLIPKVKLEDGRALSDPNVSAKLSRRHLQQVNLLADTFWKRWVREYLPELQRRGKWTQENRHLSRGDIVLVMEPTVPRSKWKLGRVMDGVKENHRSVQVRTENGIVTRAIQKLCLLEKSE